MHMHEIKGHILLVTKYPHIILRKRYQKIILYKISYAAPTVKLIHCNELIGNTAGNIRNTLILSLCTVNNFAVKLTFSCSLRNCTRFARYFRNMILVLFTLFL
jgi:hypothetical protein